MVSETFGDPFAAARASAFVEALQRYTADGHPISQEDGTDPDVPPSVAFRVEREIFRDYLRAQGLELSDD